ncbi:hypothetical protein RTBOTA2_003142 [Rhodotorula toruloides]|uniref:Proteophosphoglycan ppg4 n=1 Tax=Rhodotorula toruloides TaxID=5286 RepID=A0A2T0AAZ0_RHOTO|nr:hypothetical protein RTBOTA2_003142 [Rhodotorula toruloides]PRQ75167.1 hypothetical protein AAT19DRAFT_14189 [Rhodotorula toruloides]
MHTQDPTWDARNVLQHAGDVRHTYKSSIGALFRLSRSWSAAAAPYRFKAIKVFNTFALVFRQRIAIRYGKFVETLHFDQADDDSDLQAILLLSPFFTRLSKIILTNAGFSDILSKGRRTKEQLAWLMFDEDEGDIGDPMGWPSLFTNITTLDLELDYHMHFIEVIRSTRCLRRLHLRGGAKGTRVDLHEAFVGFVFEAVPGLDTFEWQGAKASTLQAFRSTESRGLAARPRLRHLSLEFEGEVQDVMGFVALFATSLESLALEFTKDSTAQHVPTDCGLPNLKSINIKGDNGDALRSFIVSIDHTTSCPALERVVLHPKDLSNDADGSTTDLLEQRFADIAVKGTLQHIQIWDASAPLGSSWRNEIVDTLAGNGLKVSMAPMNPFPDPYFLNADYTRHRDNQPDTTIPDSTEALDRVFTFLGDWYARAKATKNPADLARLAVVLERAEIERVIKTGG